MDKVYSNQVNHTGSVFCFPTSKPVDNINIIAPPYFVQIFSFIKKPWMLWRPKLMFKINGYNLSKEKLSFLEILTKQK